jgi:hypothetical protein
MSLDDQDQKPDTTEGAGRAGSPEHPWPETRTPMAERLRSPFHHSPHQSAHASPRRHEHPAHLRGAGAYSHGPLPQPPTMHPQQPMNYGYLPQYFPMPGYYNMAQYGQQAPTPFPFAPPPQPPPLPPVPPATQPLDDPSVQRIIQALMGQRPSQAPAVAPRVFVPKIAIVTNRSAFTNNKHWEKANSKLSKRNKNWDLWREEFIRALGAVAPLDKYIDHSPAITGSYLPRPVVTAFSTAVEQESAHNWDENDENVRKLIRAVVEKEEWVKIERQSLTSARDVFRALETRHSGGSTITLWTLWEKVMSLTIDGSSSDQIHKVIADLRILLDRIWSIATPSKEDMRAMILLRAVNDVKTVQAQLVDDIANRRLTEDTVVRRLETEAEMLARSGQTVDQYAAIVSDDDTVCLRCAGYGHIARSCGSAATVGNSPHVKALIAKRRDGKTSSSGPFKSHYHDGKKPGKDAKYSAPKDTSKPWRRTNQANIASDGATDGSARADGSTRTVILDGVTYTAAAAITDVNSESDGSDVADSDSEAAGQPDQWAGAAELDVSQMDAAAIDALLAADEAADETVIGGEVRSNDADVVLAVLSTSKPPPPIPLCEPGIDASDYKTFELTTNPHVAAHMGEMAWFLDSGATMHCTPDEEELKHVREIAPIPIRGVNGARMQATKVGSKTFRFADGTSLTVYGVLVIPDAALRLVSIGRLADVGMRTLFDKRVTTILAPDANRPLATASRAGTGLYSVDVDDVQLNAARAGVPLETWHGRYGHPAADHVDRLIQSDAVKGMHVDLSHRPPKCQSCIRGKQKQTAVPKRREGERASAFLDLVYVDLTGSQERTATPNSEHYTMNILDDHTHWLWTFLLKTKDQALSTIIAWHARTARASGRSVGTLQINNGELKSIALEHWAGPLGITVRTTAPYSSSQNGKVERVHLSVDNCARAMRIAAGLPETTWGEFVKTASYLYGPYSAQ